MEMEVEEYSILLKHVDCKSNIVADLLSTKDGVWIMVFRKSKNDNINKILTILKDCDKYDSVERLTINENTVQSL